MMLFMMVDSGGLYRVHYAGRPPWFPLCPGKISRRARTGDDPQAMAGAWRWTGRVDVYGRCFTSLHAGMALPHCGMGGGPTTRRWAWAGRPAGSRSTTTPRQPRWTSLTGYVDPTARLSNNRQVDCPHPLSRVLDTLRGAGPWLAEHYRSPKTDVPVSGPGLGQPPGRAG